MATDNKFLGTGWGFPPSFNWRDKHAVLVAQEEDIDQSLRILLSTVPGERVMQPAYGCGLKRMVFESVNESTVTEIKDIVAKAVLFFEVRITLEAVQVELDEMLHGVLKLRLDYRVRTTNTRHNMVYPLYLLEGTGVV